MADSRAVSEGQHDPGAAEMADRKVYDMGRGPCGHRMSRAKHGFVGEGRMHASSLKSVVAAPGMNLLKQSSCRSTSVYTLEQTRQAARA